MSKKFVKIKSNDRPDEWIYYNLTGTIYECNYDHQTGRNQVFLDEESVKILRERNKNQPFKFSDKPFINVENLITNPAKGLTNE